LPTAHGDALIDGCPQNLHSSPSGLLARMDEYLLLKMKFSYVHLHLERQPPRRTLS
jgi:hypothetical protein